MKIIGFLITTKENKRIKIDFFNVGLKIFTIKYHNYYVYLWGIGNIKDYKIDDKYSLSFPIHNSLLDRNILLYFKDQNIIVENDWLGSIPVFYNKKEKIVSTISNFCIKDKIIHDEGLANFCEFGYSILEQTMFKDIKFMRYYSKLMITNEIIKIDYKEDFVLNDDFLSSPESSEKSVINLMQDYVSNIENQIEGDIILPTSGGYDSRILNYLIKEKNRIKSFTYGISKNQIKSFEVVYANQISKIYNTKWEWIELKDFHKYINKWFDIYGISTHLHGMYHIEFYKKIITKENKFTNPTFLSGIFGDIWAGSINYKDINTSQKIKYLGYTHGVSLDLEYLSRDYTDKIKDEFFLNIKSYIRDDRIKAIFTIRMKLILISYLTQIPEYFAMPVWTPFLNFDVVKFTLNIKKKRKKNRVWQKDFFKSVGLNLEDMNLSYSRRNMLNHEIAKNTTFEPLNEKILSKYISSKKLLDINKCLLNLNKDSLDIDFVQSLKTELFYTPKLGGVMRRLGFKNKPLQALNEYYILKSIEKGLQYRV